MANNDAAPPLVSIIMNCHNCGKYLAQSLDSVYKQTFKEYEIILWDNQSTDNSGEIASNYGEPLRYFRGEQYLPLGAARNAAIEKATGKYIAFLDCDDIWLPEKLERQVELLESNQELGLVYSDSRVIDSHDKTLKKTYFHSLKPFQGNVFNELLVSNFIPILTVVVTREALDKVGLFDPKYIIAEDYDLWLRIAEYYPIGFIEQPLASYRLHGESASQRNMIRSYQEEVQIKEYWLDRDPSLSKQLGGKIRWRRLLLYIGMFLTALKNIFKNRNRKSIREFRVLIRYLLLARL
jgi:glycosyltransferase involved in cell wall biosynthesis